MEEPTTPGSLPQHDSDVMQSKEQPNSSQQASCVTNSSTNIAQRITDMAQPQPTQHVPYRFQPQPPPPPSPVTTHHHVVQVHEAPVPRMRVGNTNVAKNAKDYIKRLRCTRPVIVGIVVMVLLVIQVIVQASSNVKQDCKDHWPGYHEDCEGWRAVRYTSMIYLLWVALTVVYLVTELKQEEMGTSSLGVYLGNYFSIWITWIIHLGTSAEAFDYSSSMTFALVLPLIILIIAIFMYPGPRLILEETSPTTWIVHRLPLAEKKDQILIVVIIAFFFSPLLALVLFFSLNTPKQMNWSILSCRTENTFTLVPYNNHHASNSGQQTSQLTNTQANSQHSRARTNHARQAKLALRGVKALTRVAGAMAGGDSEGFDGASDISGEGSDSGGEGSDSGGSASDAGSCDMDMGD